MTYRFHHTPLCHAKHVDNPEDRIKAASLNGWSRVRQLHLHHVYLRRAPLLVLKYGSSVSENRPLHLVRVRTEHRVVVGMPCQGGEEPPEGLACWRTSITWERSHAILPLNLRSVHLASVTTHLMLGFEKPSDFEFDLARVRRDLSMSW